MTAQDFIKDVQEGRSVFLDLSASHAYSRSHPAGTYNFPFHRRNWGEEVKRALNGQTPAIGLFAENNVIANSAKESLEAAGLAVAFVFDKGIKGWEAEGLPLERVKDLTVDELSQNLDKYVVVDVREPYELRSGVIPGALTIPMAQLQNRLSELDKSKSLAVVCASGGRSASASSFLSQQGFDVSNVVGGMSLWIGSRHPVEHP